MNAFNPFWEKLYQNPVQFFSVIPRGAPLPHSNELWARAYKTFFMLNSAEHEISKLDKFNLINPLE